MIRIKCPKCSTVLSLDDDQAGQLGECTECQAKFRVPAAKAAAPARGPAQQPPKKLPAAKQQAAVEEEEEDEEEELDEEEEEVAEKKPKRKRSRQAAAAFKANMITGIALAVVVIVLFVAGIFINSAGIIAAGLGAVGMIYCMLMVSVMAKQDSGLWFLMIWILPGSLFLYALQKWEQTQKLAIAYLGLLALVIAGLVSSKLHESRVEEQRAYIRKTYLSEAAVVRLHLPT